LGGANVGGLLRDPSALPRQRDAEDSDWPSAWVCGLQMVMGPGTSNRRSAANWKPHPDDEADVSAAAGAADRNELLSAEASEGFVRWLEGHDDLSWRAESE